jgi:hypothetical protein
VQRLVKLLALKLDVRSEVGKGSAFSIVLPASSAENATAPGSVESSVYGLQQIGEARVLLVEDNRNLTTLRVQLTSQENVRTLQSFRIPGKVRNADWNHGRSMLGDWSRQATMNRLAVTDWQIRSARIDL